MYFMHGLATSHVDVLVKLLLSRLSAAMLIIQEYIKYWGCPLISRKGKAREKNGEIESL